MFLNGAGALGTSGKDFDWWMIKIAELRSPSVNMSDTWIHDTLVGYGIDSTNIALLLGTAYPGSPAVVDSINKWRASDNTGFTAWEVTQASTYVAPDAQAPAVTQTQPVSVQSKSYTQAPDAAQAKQATTHAQTYEEYVASQNYVAPGSASSGAVVGTQTSAQPAAQKSNTGILALLAAGLAAINLF